MALATGSIRSSLAWLDANSSPPEADTQQQGLVSGNWEQEK
jgi:hypothetical protein